MSKVIYKYNLEITDSQEIVMPDMAEILSVGVQNDVLCLWAMIDKSVEVRKYRFLIFGTGHPILLDTSTMKHLATIQLPPFVWHLFLDQSTN